MIRRRERHVPHHRRTPCEPRTKMPDLEDLRDLWGIDLELAGSNPGPIPIITTPPEKTWVWSDLHFGDRGALFAF